MQEQGSRMLATSRIWTGGLVSSDDCGSVIGLGSQYAVGSRNNGEPFGAAESGRERQ